MNYLFRGFITLFSIMLAGAIGGILIEQIVLPKLANSSFVEGSSWLRQIVKDKVVIINNINKTEKITISENKAIEELIDRAKIVAVGVISKRAQKSGGVAEQLMAKGTGFILTADGVIVTANNNLPSSKTPDSIKYYILKDGKTILAKIIERDAINNIALLKIDDTNLPVLSLGSLDELRLGQTIVLIGAEIKDETILDKFINLTTARSISTDAFTLNIKQEIDSLNGGLLVNVNGEIVGLSLIDSLNNIKTISVNKIRDLLNNK